MAGGWGSGDWHQRIINLPLYWCLFDLILFFLFLFLKKILLIFIFFIFHFFHFSFSFFHFSFSFLLNFISFCIDLSIFSIYIFFLLSLLIFLPLHFLLLGSISSEYAFASCSLLDCKLVLECDFVPVCVVVYCMSHDNIMLVHSTCHECIHACV